MHFDDHKMTQIKSFYNFNIILLNPTVKILLSK